MMEILKLQQKIVPEMVELLEKRYKILRTIYYHQPIGRRVLANTLNLGERIVRTEICFLKEQNLIDISAPGMCITEEGEELVDKLKDFLHELKGLSELEVNLRKALHLRDVIVVPGDLDWDSTIMSELGRAAAAYLKSLIKDNYIIALTGGSTIKEVIDNTQNLPGHKNVLVVPARGGMGKNVELQANTLAARLASKIGGSYKLLHVPDNLSLEALSTMRHEDEISDVIESINNADILLYGIGRADEMGKRRGLNEALLKDLLEKGAVGEAFGHYFDSIGNIIYSSPTIGIKNEDIKRIHTKIAVAGGSSKAEAILSTSLDNNNNILITDEGAAKKINALLSDMKKLD